jgi:succinoglycan biosynthesis protein ExoM
VRIETIVVDNDEGESARDIVESRADSLDSIRYCIEPRRNIAHARNCAVSQANGEWLVFIDDDEAAEENWIAGYWELIERAQCDGAMGPVLPRLEEVVTPWLDVETFYTRSRHTTGELLGEGGLYTSNALVRRQLFVGRGFDPTYGLTGGSDSELFGRMLQSGARFLWCDEAPVVEFVPPERHRVGWLAQRAFRGGLIYTRIARSQLAGGNVSRASRALAQLCGFALLTPLAALGGRRALVRVVLRMCTQVGHLWALMGRSYEEYGAGFSTGR